MSKVRVVVVGASGFGRETLDVLNAMKEVSPNFEVCGVVDDSPSVTNLKRIEARQINYLGSVGDYLRQPPPDSHFVIGIGNSAVRKRLHSRFLYVGMEPFTAIHPTAVIGENSVVGSGCVICAGAVVSTNVSLYDGVHINPNATVGHDSILEEYVSVNPGAIISGEVTIGNLSLVGAGAIVLQGLIIGERTLIGAGSVVTKDIPSDVTVKGSPGRW